MTMTAAHTLPIRRLFCAFCRHTFALLPSFVVKFHRYARESIRRALRLLGSHTYEAVAGMFAGQVENCIAIMTLHLWRRRFSMGKP